MTVSNKLQLSLMMLHDDHNSFLQRYSKSFITLIELD